MAVAVLWIYFADYKKVSEYKDLWNGENQTLMLAIAGAESGFNPNAISKKGAVGLCQIMPKTAEWCCEMMGIAYDENLLYVPIYNAKIAEFYVDYLLEKFGNTEVAICAYNAGEGRVANWISDPEIYKNEKFSVVPYEETANYLQKVQSNYKKYKFYLWIMNLW